MTNKIAQIYYPWGREYGCNTNYFLNIFYPFGPYLKFNGYGYYIVLGGATFFSDSPVHASVPYVGYRNNFFQTITK